MALSTLANLSLRLNTVSICAVTRQSSSKRAFCSLDWEFYVYVLGVRSDSVWAVTAGRAVQRQTSAGRAPLMTRSAVTVPAGNVLRRHLRSIGPDQDRSTLPRRRASNGSCSSLGAVTTRPGATAPDR